MKKRMEPTTLLIWLGIILILLWIVAKLTGTINTPVWIEMIPFISGLAILMGIALNAGKILERINNLSKNQIKIIKKVDNLSERLILLENKD